MQVRSVLLISMFSVIPGLATSGDILSDSFETGDMSTPDNIDFQWDRNNRTSIVTMDPGPVAIWNNRYVYNEVSDGRDWTAYHGDNSLRFRYPAGSEWAEQRFSIGTAHSELWMSFWLRVPENFHHNNPSGSAANNKLFSLWMDGYSADGDGSTVNMEFRPDGSAGGSRFYVKTTRGRNNVTGGDQGSVPFIRVPEHRGKWMNLVIRVVAESSEDKSDGTVEVWRKWDGDSSYTKTHDRNNQPLRLPASGPQGFSNGYLMGYANATYSENTEFLIDDFKLSTHSLLDTRSRPNPPQNASIGN